MSKPSSEASAPLVRFSLLTYAAAGVAPAALYIVRRSQWEGDFRARWIAAAVLCLAAMRHRVALEGLASRFPSFLRLLVRTNASIELIALASFRSPAMSLNLRPSATGTTTRRTRRRSLT